MTITRQPAGSPQHLPEQRGRERGEGWLARSLRVAGEVVDNPAHKQIHRDPNSYHRDQGDKRDDEAGETARALPSDVLEVVVRFRASAQGRP